MDMFETSHFVLCGEVVRMYIHSSIIEKGPQSASFIDYFIQSIHYQRLHCIYSHTHIEYFLR